MKQAANKSNKWIRPTPTAHEPRTYGAGSGKSSISRWFRITDTTLHCWPPPPAPVLLYLNTSENNVMLADLQMPS